MRPLVVIYFIIFSTVFVAAQNGSTMDDLLIEAETSVFTNPNQALKVGQYVLRTTTDSQQKLEATLTMASAFYTKGNIDKALQILLKSNKRIENGTHELTQIKMYMRTTHLFQILGLQGLVKGYSGKAAAINPQNEPIKNWLKGTQSQNRAFSFYENGEYQKALNSLYKAKSVFNKNKKRPNFQIDPLEIDLAKTHLKRFQLDSAAHYLKTALAESRKAPVNKYLEMLALSEMGTLFFLKKENEKAIENLEAALKIATKFENLRIQKSITENLASNYLVLDDKKNFFLFNQKVFPLANAIEIQKNRALNTAYNFVNETQSEKIAVTKTAQNRTVYILGAVLFLLLLSGYFWNSRLRTREKQYTDFLTYLELTTQKPDANLPKKELGKSQVTPVEIEKSLLLKLNRFERSVRFTAKDMSLAQLASKFETNTKYLSEVINHHKDKNFNSYINELRIGYIIEKLKHDPSYLNYKISYLADESGFTSHSSFATVFKSITGIPPTVFMEILSAENQKTEKIRTEEMASTHG